MSHPRIARRVALRLLAAGTTVQLGSLAGCGDGGPSGPIGAGNVSALPVGTLRVVDSEAVAIGRDANGVYAMTLICTHAQCDISSDGTVSANGVRCSCHGSAFDANGAVVHGPAHDPLDHFSVSIDGGGEITIDADTVVDASTRTPVPA